MTFNLADLYESVADTIADRTAMVAGDRRLTYSELDQRANRLAHHLAGAGIGPGDRVGIQLVNGTEYIECMLACFKIRSVPVNVNYRYVAAELTYLYKDADLSGLVYHGKFDSAVEEAASALRSGCILVEVADGTESTGIGADYESVLAASDNERHFEPRSSDDLYCVYTGGTTGMPKGVLWRHEDIFFAAMGGGDPLSFGDVISAPDELPGRVLPTGIVALAVPPFMHASGHWLAFSNLFGGGTVVTMTGSRFDPHEVWRLVDAEGVNAVVVVGDAMARPLVEVLLDDPEQYDLSSLMALGSGGAVLSSSTKQQLAEVLPGRIVADLFGSSETGQMGGEASSDDPFSAPRLRINERTDVLDDRLEPVARDSTTIGKLARAGHVPIGYLGDPEKSAATFVEAHGRRWSLPGDAATVDEDGVITVLGRANLSINTGGEKVFPDEVEAVLKGHPDVVDATVVGLPDERFGQRVVAVIQARAGQVVDAEELRDFCRSRLSGYKIPRQIVAVAEIVRSPSGKPDYPWAKKTAEDALTSAQS